MSDIEKLKNIIGALEEDAKQVGALSGVSEKLSNALTKLDTATERLKEIGEKNKVAIDDVRQSLFKASEFQLDLKRTVENGVSKQSALMEQLEHLSKQLEVQHKETLEVGRQQNLELIKLVTEQNQNLSGLSKKVIVIFSIAFVLTYLGLAIVFYLKP